MLQTQQINLSGVTPGIYRYITEKLASSWIQGYRYPNIYLVHELCLR